MNKDELYKHLNPFEIHFKELAESILKGERKGIFTLYNSMKFSSDVLRKSNNPHYSYKLNHSCFPFGYWYYNDFGNSNCNPIINFEGYVITNGLRKNYDKYAILSFEELEE